MLTRVNRKPLGIFTFRKKRLFKENQGVVAEGQLTEGIFRAKTILAKHDENYMPKEVAESLKKTGKWKGTGKN